MKNELLAPNGKPSNLNATQYKLVRTPAFKKWFGDWINDPANASKVVDENGEPMVVYHRTKLKFYKFDLGSNLIGWLGRGFYFSPNKNEFKEYGRSVLPCFLNIKNLFVSKGEDDGYLFSEVKSINKSKVFNETDVSQTLKENGYNGVLLKHWDRGVIINCFESNQIKLSDGTNTTFDSSNDDIRFDDGGQFNNKGFIIEELDKDYKKVYQNRAFKNISGFDFFFSRLNVYPELNVFTIELPNGMEIGRATLNEKENYLTNIRINENYRRKGLALNLYDYIEYIIGKKLKPSPDKISIEAQKLWLKRNPDIQFKNGGEIDLQIDERVKKLRNDKDFFPFEILNKKGEKLGKIELMYRSDLGGYQISNSNVFEKGKGIGKKAYLKLRQILGKPIISDSSRTEDAENLWKSLERTNDAKYNSEIGKYSIYENGGRTISQTPSPSKDRIVGSEVNKKSSSKNLSNAKLIKFDEKTIEAIKNKVAKHNEEYPNKKINLASAKAVVRRGFGAYSSSHRPTISGGKPNSRVAWGLARLNAFIYKIVNGKSKSGKYSQDDDLIEELGYKVADYKNGGKMEKDIRCINCGWEWNKKDSELWDMYVCHKCGFDNTTFYTSIPINNYSKGGETKTKSPNYLKMFLDL